MTEESLKRQSETIEKLRSQLAALNQQFEEQKRALGLPAGELVEADGDVPAELEGAMQQACAQAKAAGQQAAADLKQETAPAPRMRGRGRRGALAV